VTQIVPVPRLGELTESVVVTRWLCAVGDVLAEGQPIAEVETDKVETEVVSPVAGRVSGLLAEEGDELDVGAGLVEVER
jgi:2-oxoglutarate dehydrogenase E2 component (dihydrolipoamide succinyltransferase)